MLIETHYIVKQMRNSILKDKMCIHRPIIVPIETKTISKEMDRGRVCNMQMEHPSFGLL